MVNAQATGLVRNYHVFDGCISGDRRDSGALTAHAVTRGDSGLVKGLTRYLNGDINWRLISTAPFNRDLELRAASGLGLCLPFPCRQTRSGWVNSDLGTRVAVEPTHWRVWPE
jgi:hypothetical protein